MLNPQAVNHLLQQSPLPGCGHVLLATADIMGIDLACDRFTPPPGLHSLDSDEDFEKSQIIESQLIDPVKSLYRQYLLQ